MRFFNLLQQNEEKAVIVKLLVSLLATVFFVEFTIMQVFLLLKVSPVAQSLLDAFILVAVLVPILYFTVFRKPFAREILLRRKAEYARERLSITLQSIGDGVIATDTSERITLMNKAAEEITGWMEPEALGMHIEDVFYIVNGVTRKRCANPVAKALKENKTVFLDADTYLITRKGKELALADSSSPIWDVDNKAIGAVITFRNIMVQKQLEDELLQSQKLKSIGQLAGGIAHDFNNMLSVIIGYSGYVLNAASKFQDDPVYKNIYQSIDEILKAGKRASLLTSQLLAFSREQRLEQAVVQINNIIEDMANMLKSLVGEGIEIIMMIDPEVKHVSVDIGQQQQVIMNLIVNARDAMPSGGKIIIKTANVSFNKESSKMIPNARPGEFICLSISDTGIGMDHEVMARMYEPFFTTKRPGKGTGLGLSVIYGIIQQQNGWINVSSEPGKGSEFSIYLPVSETGEALSSSEKKSIPIQDGRGVRILLVEDEEGIRKFVAKVLSENNYTVFEAADAKEATDIFNMEKGNFGLLFTDSVLPDKHGVELIEQIIPAKSDIKIILSSGYLDDKSHWKLIKQKGYPFLQKPFDATSLLTIVNEVIYGRKEIL